jgi:hypothetical protein
VAVAILMELNIRLTVLVVETARLERRGVNDSHYAQCRYANCLLSGAPYCALHMVFTLINVRLA